MKKLFTSSIRIILIIIFFTSLICSQQQPEYEIVRIGGLQNLGWNALAINDNTEIVGNLPHPNGEQTMPFLWKNNQITYLAYPDYYAGVYDINNLSQMTGHIGHDPFGNTIYNPAIWHTPTEYFEIIISPDFNFGWPTAINDSGIVCGYLTNTSGSNGFIYNGILNVIPNLPNCNTRLLDINNSGMAIGYRIYNDTIYNAITWSNGLITEYGDEISYQKINNLGHIAGYTISAPSAPRIAVKIINGIPHYVNNGLYTSSYAFSINDSTVMVGYAYTGVDPTSRAVKFIDDQIIDLNLFIPPDSAMFFQYARDINNRGEIIVTGYYPPNIYQKYNWLLRKPRVEITHPAKGELLISGTKDSVMWTGGKANQNVDIEYSTDGGNSWRLDLIAENIPADTGKWHWEVPENIYSRKSLIRIYDHSTYETVIESDTFKIKPLILTKLDADSEYVSYNFANDRFGFGNVDDKVWPPWYYSRFNYAGIDPVTGYIYDPLEYGYVFSLANPSDFPDWGSFVSTFSVTACYHSTVPPVVYSLTALERWEAKKRNWGGSCFGIAAANGLIFERKNQFLNKFPDVSYFENPINLTTPDTGDIAAITALFTHQFGNPTKANDNVSYNIKTPNQTLSEIIEMLKEDEVKIKTLTIYNNNGAGAHTILAYQVKRHKDFPDLFYVYVYDNSYPNVNDGFILVDTAANSGNGDWGVSYAWNNWGGTKNIYLEIPDSNYLKPATLSKGTQFQSPFIIKQNELEINNTQDASILIKDNSNNITGYQNNQVFSNIPASRPLFIKNGSEDPPYGYYLQTDNYEIEMKDFTVTNPSIYLFTDNKSFSVKRDNATITQTDKFKYWMEQKLEISNPDNEPKTYQLTEIINESVKEKMYILRNVEMNQNDLFEMKSIDEDKLKITNYGSQKNYEIELQAVSAAGFGRFLNSSINLSVTSNHTILPDWTDVTNSLLMILVDIGNNGTIDDTLFIENEVTGIGENQGLLIPTEYRLEQNYPNPFNPSTKISWQSPVGSHQTLKVFDVLGNEIATLVDEYKPAGRYEVEFNAEKLASGIYFYQLKAGEYTAVKKMLLIR